jgi:hypothetical protein
VLTTADLARYSSPRRRAHIARAALLTLLVVDLVAIWSSQAEYSLLGRIGAGEFVSDDEITRNDNRQAAIGIVQLALYVVCVVSFLTWFVQAYRNAEALGGDGLRSSPRGAIWWWFVPFANLVRPKQIANDIWRASSPDLPLARQRRWDLDNPPFLLLAWWLAFLVAGWVGNVAARYSAGETVEDLQRLDNVYMAADFLDAVAAALAIVVVTLLTRRQEVRFARAQVAAEAA